MMKSLLNKLAKKGFWCLPLSIGLMIYIFIWSDTLLGQTILDSPTGTTSAREISTKDKIVFATRIDGKMVYAEAEISLSLETIEPVSAPIEILSGPLGVAKIKMLPEPRVSSLCLDGSVKTLEESRCCSATKAGIYSTNGDSFLPFDRIEETSMIAPTGGGFTEPCIIFGSGSIDLFWKEKDPLPEKRKLYLPEQWFEFLKEIPPSLNSPSGGIRINTSNKGENSYEICVWLTMMGGLARYDGETSASFLRGCIYSIYHPSIHSVQLSYLKNIGEESKGLAERLVPFIIRSQLPSWVKDHIALPIWKDSRKRLMDAEIQQILESPNEIAEVRGVPLRLKIPSDSQREKHGVVLVANSFADVLKAFEAEGLELKSYYDGCNNHWVNEKGGISGTLKGCIWRPGTRIPMSVKYALKRNPQIRVTWGWDEEVNNVVPPLRLWL